MIGVSSTSFSISTFAVRRDANCLVCLEGFVCGYGKYGRLLNTSSDETSSLGHIVSLMALILKRRMCFSFSDLRSIARMLKTRRLGLWYCFTCPIALWDIIFLHFKSTRTPLVLFLKLYDVNDDF